MDNKQSFKEVDGRLLKECYDLAARFEKLEPAKEILRAKSKAVGKDSACYSFHGSASHQKTEMQIISEIMHVLSAERFSATNYSSYVPMHEVQNLPNSAEKEFLMALLSLRSGKNESQRISALQHLRTALVNSSEDPRYIALASILSEVEL